MRSVSELLEALYRDDRARVDELLAGEPELSVFESAAFGRVSRVEELLAADPALANAYGDDGFQPLGLACFFGHVDAVRLLLERGADPNTLARNEHIQTAGLHAAAAAVRGDEATRVELCTLLLAAGADPNLRQGGGSRPIDAARHNGDTKLEALLRAHGAEG
jgi:ankyrin repeat protein